MKLKTFPFLLLALLTASAASAFTVKVDFYGSVDFSRFRTYAWQKGTPAPNYETEKAIHAAIDARLTAGRWQRAEDGADVYVRSHAAKNPTFLYVILVVEVFDAKTGQRIWRGQVSDVPPDKPKKARSVVKKAVKKMFKNFPKVAAP